ncbi:Fic family protein [Thalassospira lucentensis]|uniref:Fic family protein n=1 Tax=Thalassospira lucentensis TaxID=168935 RepID=UPI0029438AA4|nr:Fic family protein [Thalassospira lucentensis]WOI08990.1 Fic family protein [Thalassospira lucentensis]
MWIWERKEWPEFEWDRTTFRTRLPGIYRKQGGLSARDSQTQQSETSLDTILENIIKSSAIEGENLDRASVRSSLASRLGLDDTVGRAVPPSSKTSGVVDLMMDALANPHAPLTSERLHKWHHWLFPADGFRPEPIDIGQWRSVGRMQVVSGDPVQPTVHFVAPPPERVPGEMNGFIKWFNDSRHDAHIDPIERAALAHLWFVTIHPFDDRNGRIARAIGDLALAQADPHSIRLYEMSSAIHQDRKGYYDVLEQTQKGTLDVNHWMAWFADKLEHALDRASQRVNATLGKTRFWDAHRDQALAPGQIKALNKLLDGRFPEGLGARHYAAFTGVSKATATRHLTDLVEKGCIAPGEDGGRSTRYHVVMPSGPKALAQALAIDTVHDHSTRVQIEAGLKLKSRDELLAQSEATQKKLDQLASLPELSRIQMQERRKLMNGLALLEKVTGTIKDSPGPQKNLDVRKPRKL